MNSQTITEIFKRHGASPLDTPVFELKEVLAGSMSDLSFILFPTSSLTTTAYKNMARMPVSYTTYKTRVVKPAL
jgi:hypothetical protein